MSNFPKPLPPRSVASDPWQIEAKHYSSLRLYFIVYSRAPNTNCRERDDWTIHGGALFNITVYYSIAHTYPISRPPCLGILEDPVS